MSDRLQGKRALVTAAAQGIGAAIATAFAREGAEVLATDIAERALDAHADTPGIRTRRLDVTDEAAVRETVAEAGPFDVLVNCAGFVHAGSALEATDEEWDFAFELNVKSMFRTIRHVLPGMRERGGGSIVNISSICAHKGLPGRFVYSASKAAVDGLSKSVAADFVADGIRCNTIRPGTVQSPSLEDRINAFDDPVAARKAFIGRQPMGRLGRPEEIAAMAVYLASDESAFTTGTLVDIDGGIST